MAVNLKGAFFACQEAAIAMRKQGKGKIVNLGSLAFEIVLPNIALYATSKGGMRQMTKALALEWAKDRINVNAIAPGRFWTQLTDAVFSKPDLYESAVSVVPWGRPGIPSDLAGAALLLASDAADYITGQTIVVDGGWLDQRRGQGVRVETVAVIGAGLMGRGIAYASALGGFRTLIHDEVPGALDRAMNRIRKDLDEGVERGKVAPAAKDEALARVGASADFDAAVAGADFVIEAVPEDIALKLRIFARLERSAASTWSWPPTPRPSRSPRSPRR